MSIIRKSYGTVAVIADPVLHKTPHVIHHTEIGGLPVIIAKLKGVIIIFNASFKIIKTQQQF